MERLLARRVRSEDYRDTEGGPSRGVVTGLSTQNIPYQVYSTQYIPNPDPNPNSYRSVFGHFDVFFRCITRSRRPTATPTPTTTLAPARLGLTRARLRHAFGTTRQKCADYHKNRTIYLLPVLFLICFICARCQEHGKGYWPTDLLTISGAKWSIWPSQPSSGPSRIVRYRTHIGKIADSYLVL